MLGKNIQNIDLKFDITTSTRLVKTSGSISLPQGVIIELSSALTGGTTGANQFPRKGEFYIQLVLTKNVSGGSLPIVLLTGYVSNSQDLHWTGEMPCEDGDTLNLVTWNSFVGPIFTLHLVGTEVLASA